ncbi:hypothetical protein Tco_1252746 [Tanacetum coccineum]
MQIVKQFFNRGKLTLIQTEETISTKVRFIDLRSINRLLIKDLPPQTHGVSKTDFERYVTANDAVLRNMQNQGQNLQSQMANLTDMLSKFVTANTASTSGSGTLPGNTVTNPKEDLKGITTEHETVQPPVVQIQSRNPNPEPNVAPVDTQIPKASIPFPSRRNDERRKEKANDKLRKENSMKSSKI